MPTGLSPRSPDDIAPEIPRRHPLARAFHQIIPTLGGSARTGKPTRAAEPARRLVLVDALRGAALAAMVVFHAGWDLAWLGLVGDGSGGVSAGWQTFGNVVAASFLGLSGFSLVLARRQGRSARRSLLRLLPLLAAAVLVTMATWIAVPRSFVTFGILHCLVVGDAAAIALVNAPLWLVAPLAAALLATPWLPHPDFFDAAGWSWLGLSARLPDTLDYRPLCPWAGYIVAGIVLARLPGRAWLRQADAAFRPPGALAWAGRHSLFVYLAHQALLFPILYGVAVLAGLPSHRPDWSEQFEAQCLADCLRTRAGEAVCHATCACAGDRLRTDPRARLIGPGVLDASDRDWLGTIAGECLRKARP